MKLELQEARAVSALDFERGLVSLTIEIPESPFRWREVRASEFRLSPEQGRMLALKILAWLDEGPT